MATSTISNTVTDPSGVAVAGVTVKATLVPTLRPFRSATFAEVAATVSTVSNGSGAWSLVLERNSDIVPSGTWYLIEEQIPTANGGPRFYEIQVGSSNQTLLASLVTPAEQQPIVVPAGTTYISQAAADARYQALGSLGSGSPALVNGDDPTGSAGVASSAARSDHDHGFAATAWTSYTPTLTQSGAVTKTVSYAKYMQIGKTVIVGVYLRVTGAGTGATAVSVGLPVAAAFTSFAIPVGVGQVFDQSAGINYPGILSITAATTASFVPSAQTATNGFLGTTIFTAALANLDEIGFSCTYEAA
jgi:hypothetical protein